MPAEKPQKEGLIVRDLIKEAMDLEEDMALTAIAEEREKTFKESKALKHEEVW